MTQPTSEASSPTRSLSRTPLQTDTITPSCRYIKAFHDKFCGSACSPLCCANVPVAADAFATPLVDGLIADRSGRSKSLEVLLGDPKFDADFIHDDLNLSSLQESPLSEWPVFHSHRWRELGDIPAVAPTISPSEAVTRLQPLHQAAPSSLVDVPYTDYNCVRPQPRWVPPTHERNYRGPTPAPGQPHTTFKPVCRISWSEGGPWVRSYIATHPSHRSVHRSASSQQESYVEWSNLELYAQVQRWFHVTKSDKEFLESCADPEQAAAHRLRSKTFIIPAHCHLGDGQIIWDHRPFLEAQAKGEDTSRITFPPISTVAQPSFKLNAGNISARMRASSCYDPLGEQQLVEAGLLSQSNAPRHTVLQPNYASLSKHAKRAADQARQERMQGCISSPYNGIPMFPIRIQPYSAVEREGKDPRFCCDMSSPQAELDGAGRDSINAGIPWDNTALIITMKLTSARSFARDVGILKSALINAPTGLRVWVAKADWTRYYRNLAKPVSEWWAQVQWLSAEGPQIDFFACFGDAAAPAQSNKVQDILLHLIAHEFSTRLDSFRLAHTTLDSWLHLDAYLERRQSALRVKFPERFSPDGSPLNVVWWERQRRIFVLQGFFDDTLMASFVFDVKQAEQPQPDGSSALLYRAEGPFELLVISLLLVAEDIGLPVAAHKLECGTDDGRSGLMCLHTWQRTGQAWWHLQQGCMTALGKELDIVHDVIRDTADRIQHFRCQVESLTEDANTHQHRGRPTVVADSLRSMVGVAMFIIMTEPHLRAALNLPIRALRLVEAVASATSRQRDKRGFLVLPQHYRAYLDHPAQDALLAMVAGAELRAGLPFNPARHRIVATSSRPAVYILEDASGSLGGGGGALFIDPAESLPGQVPPFPAPLWSYHQFSSLESQNHSTFLEGFDSQPKSQAGPSCRVQ